VKSPKPPEAAARPTGDLWAVVRKAEAGDAAALPALRAAMDGSPALVEALGDLAAQVEHTLVGAAAGTNLAFREGVGRKLARMRADLAGDRPPPLERLLADRIALCWLALHDAEVRFAQAKDLTLRQAEWWQKRIDAAHKRYLSAIKALATVRKLGVPAVQVNIARRQVNVLAAPPAGEGQRASRPAGAGTLEGTAVRHPHPERPAREDPPAQPN
jgi:hypothetical protein